MLFRKGGYPFLALKVKFLIINKKILGFLVRIVKLDNFEISLNVHLMILSKKTIEQLEKYYHNTNYSS